MRKMLMTILALVGASSLFVPVRVYADIEQAMWPEKRDVTRAARLRTSLDLVDPDTVFIGHIDDPSYTAGGTMQAGGVGPYRVGRGPNFPTRSGVPTTIGDNGTWSFDRFQPASGTGPTFRPAENDSLFGWWPVARPYQSGATTFGDFKRAFQGLDYGNQVNYVINLGAPKRTFGVTGLWHRDAGNTVVYGAGNTILGPTGLPSGTNPQPVLWSPTEVGGAGSTASAWMGIRSHGDLSHRDSFGGTGNPFDASLLQYNGNNGFNQVGSVAVNGTDHNFPGYGSQLDQMLYRDVHLNEGDGLTISFNFSTNMSTSVNSTPGAQVGWFDKDPISNAQIGVGAAATPSNDGNFICASVAGPNAPIDSFMVYVGAPVDDNNVTFSAPLFVGVNEITTVYDKQRRWFSEVLQITGPGGIIGKEIVSTAGINAPAPVSCNVGALYPTELQAIKDADGSTGDGGTVRIVFRVKTNRGFDDENAGNPSSSFNSGTRGAAIVDNVVVNSWAAANGNFEAADAINNDTGVAADAAWKSTGKPPAIYFHVHSVALGQGLVFNDPCGGQDSPDRQCNLYGNVITSGDHDAAEKDGGLFGSNTQDRQRWFVSPTINLSSTGNGPGFYNAMGVDDDIARTTLDYGVVHSYYNAGHVNATTETGNFVSTGFQTYPARQINGNISWGEARHTASIFFYGAPRGCFETDAILNGNGGAKENGLVITTNAENRPDSLRVYFQRINRCYTFTALTAATCSPTVGDNVGTYFDNISVMLTDGAPPPTLSIPIWMLINDAFPANGTNALIPAGFDTCAAQIRIGLNNAANTGNASRPAITGDSVVVTASGAGVRLDMVFRVLPGPGNYVTTGSKSSGPAQRPDVPVKVAATAGDGTFFGSYMANTGQFGSQADHIGQGPGGTNWNQNIWNSARCDTIENNLFPTANNISNVGLVPGFYASMYHESDPKFGTLGALKNKCVMLAPGGFTNSINIRCDGVLSNWNAYSPALGVFTSGWDSNVQTREYSKIIPDGLLTPGSHVEYFFRKSAVTNSAVFEMCPDTNLIVPQSAEGSNDGHRWQQFGVLPDRWKDGAWSIADRNAPAPACMLYVDWEDRRGDERLWVGIADSIGATASTRFGAHNGWHARGDQDITVAIATDPTIAVYTHGGQPGTIWDMFGVKASESSTTSSSLGSRATTAGTGFQTGKSNLNGPTGLMLRNYYRVLLALTGDLNAGNIGPYADKGDNDVGLLQDFASGTAGTSQPRAIWFQGRNFMEGQITGGGAAHALFVNSFFGAGLSTGDYRFFAGNTNNITDLIPVAPINTTGTIYGMLNLCTITNDALTLSGTFGSAMTAKYPDTGTGTNPKIASVYAPSSLPATTHPMITLVDGFRISSLGTRNTLTSIGRIDYYYNVITNLFGSLNCLLAPGGPVSAGENPNQALVNFLALRSENPFRGGAAKISFGITRKEKVELKVYDVTGRLVKTLANREFNAGSHDLFWDGSNDDGSRVSRGVYFYQLRTPSFVSQKKLAVLKD
jgi:hypothetical protein